MCGAMPQFTSFAAERNSANASKGNSAQPPQLRHKGLRRNVPDSRARRTEGADPVFLSLIDDKVTFAPGVCV